MDAVSTEPAHPPLADYPSRIEIRPTVSTRGVQSIIMGGIMLVLGAFILFTAIMAGVSWFTLALAVVLLGVGVHSVSVGVFFVSLPSPFFIFDSTGFVVNAIGGQHVFPWHVVTSVRLSRALGQPGLAIDVTSFDDICERAHATTFDQKLQGWIGQLSMRSMMFSGMILMLRPSLFLVVVARNMKEMFRALKRVTGCDYFLPAMYLDRSLVEAQQLFDRFRLHYGRSHGHNSPL